MAQISALPVGSRLFHIGIPKSGTTSLQMAASAQRAELQRQGVLYPGDGINQRSSVLAFMGRRWGWEDGGTRPEPEEWDALMAEIEASDAKRAFFGHEFAAESGNELAGRFVEAIGPQGHILITLRNFGAILPSAWQQYIKAGYTIGFDDWLRAVLGDPPDRTATPKFHRRNNQGRIVARWARTAGPQNVTVVIVDPDHPHRLTESVERLLALTPGTLTSDDLTGFGSNRGLTTAEAELFRRLNAVIEDQDVPWNDFERIVRNGAQRRMLEETAGDDDRPMLPPWAAERAAERGAEFAERIAQSGAQIVGDLAALSQPVPARPDSLEPVELIPIDAAAEALAGMLSAGTWRGADFRAPDEDPTDHEVALREAQAVRKMTQVSLGRLTLMALISLRARLTESVRRGFARARAAARRE